MSWRTIHSMIFLRMVSKNESLSNSIFLLEYITSPVTLGSVIFIPLSSASTGLRVTRTLGQYMGCSTTLKLPSGCLSVLGTAPPLS